MSRAALQHAPQASGKSAAATSLRIGPAHDTFEQEADRAAQGVTSGEYRHVAWSLSRIGLGPIQRQASASGGTAAAPPIVHEVLRSPGRPLDAQTRAFMEPRFGHDFGKVRVHTDERAAESARAVNASAYTVGQDIVFAAGRHAPGTEAGRHLLAHELAHVAQQSVTQPTASTGDLEREASRAASSMSLGRGAKIGFAAAPGSMLFEQRTIQGKVFSVGDVVLNPGASADVRTHGVLLPGPDQAHVVVTGDNKLGYEIANPAPDDPYRWQHLKDIVDMGHVDISAVTPTTDFKVKEATQAGANIVTKTLSQISLGAGGVTLPRLSVQKAINPTARVYIASADDSRDQIFYDASGGGGRGMLGSSSLAHEFFGHLWLSMNGVSWQHGGQIAASQGIQDPAGRAYAGDVNDFIDHYAAASSSANQSPTQGVSPALQQQTLGWLLQNGAAGLTRLPNNKFKVSPAFGAQWERLSGEYAVLKFHHEADAEPPAAAPANPASVKTAAGLRSSLMTWVGGLNADQKWAFKSFISALTAGWAGPQAAQNRRPELAQDIAPLLP